MDFSKLLVTWAAVWAACLSAAYAHTTALTFVNRCSVTVWPGAAANGGHPLPARGGFALAPGHARRITVPWTWQGRFWARTGCRFDSRGAGACATGDCGGRLECDGHVGQPPATLAQFSLQGDGQPSFYDVSLVDGFNVGMWVSPGGGSRDCSSAGCGSDVNRCCPSELQVVGRAGNVVACKSACLAFALDQFCCTNRYEGPQKCRPSVYSKIFKEACPASYSYAYDSPPPLFSCVTDSFTVTFCPSATKPDAALGWCDSYAPLTTI